MDPEIIRRAMEEMRTLGYVTEETRKAMEGLTKGQQLFKQAIHDVVGVAAAYTKEMYHGKQGAAAFNSSIDKTSQALGRWLRMIPVVGDSLAEMAGAAGEATKELNLLSDRLFTTYQALSRTGLAAADGMAGVRDAAQRLGYGLDEVGLQDFTKLMSESSTTIARLGGSAVEGRKRFLELASIVKTTAGTELRMLGMTVPEINESIADYIKLQTNLGFTQTMSTEQMRQGAVAFAQELDILAKLTGEQKEQLRSQMEAAQNEQRFRARLELLRRKGDQASIDAAQNIQLLNATVAKSTPGLAKGLRDIIAAGGAVTTDAAAKAMLATEGRIQDIARRALRGEDYVGLFNELAGAVDKGTNRFLEVSAQADMQDVYGDLAELRNLGNRYIDKEGKLRDKLTGELIKQVEGADGAVKSQVDLRTAQMNTTASLQTFVSKGVNPATRALQKLAGLPEAAAGTLPGEAAGGPIPGAGGAAAAPGGATGAAGLRGAAAKNLNPGNLRFAGQAGATRGAGGFAAFPSVDEGLVALAKQLNLYLTGKSAMGQLDTVASLIGAYAPPNENDTKAYVNKVAGFMGIDANAKLGKDPATMAKLMAAIIGVENHGDPVKGYNFRSGIQFAVAQVLGIDPSKIGKFADGGIARGPTSGYPAVLHGAEAVIPLPDGKTIPVEIKGLGSDQLIEQLGGYLSRANLLYKETQPEAGIYKNTSPEYIASVMKLFGMAAERAAEAQLRNINYVESLRLLPSMDQTGLMKQLADGGITQGPSIAGEAGPEAVVPLPDGRTIPVTMSGLTETMDELISLTRRSISVQEKIAQNISN